MNGRVTLKWNGPGAKAYVENLAAKRIQAAAMWFAGKIKLRLSTPIPPRSKPGQYLHKDTGHLRRNIAHEFDRPSLTARVGTNVPYGLEWQIGSIGPARPWLSKALNEFSRGIINILERGAP